MSHQEQSGKTGSEEQSTPILRGRGMHASRVVEPVKMWHLYGMGTRLVNVRLDEERIRKARALRASGIAISDLVREAIDHRYGRVVRSPKGLDVAAIRRRIFEEYPDPPDLPPRGYDVRDRAAARRAVLRQLRRKTR